MNTSVIQGSSKALMIKKSNLTIVILSLGRRWRKLMSSRSHVVTLWSCLKIINSLVRNREPAHLMLLWSQVL